MLIVINNEKPGANKMPDITEKIYIEHVKFNNLNGNFSICCKDARKKIEKKTKMRMSLCSNKMLYCKKCDKQMRNKSYIFLKIKRN